MQPTSKFGELFQYSNPLAAAAGFIGGHVAFPKLELGKAYDEAMQHARVRAARHDGRRRSTSRRRSRGNYAVAARAGHRRQDGTRGACRELLDHPGAARGRRVEQRATTC